MLSALCEKVVHYGVQNVYVSINTQVVYLCEKEEKAISPFCYDLCKWEREWDMAEPHWGQPGQ